MLPDVTSRRATASDATATASSVSATLPESIANRYDIIRFIGGGGMGRVFVAYDRSLKRNVAIKVLAPALAVHPVFSRQLLREARAAAQLDHAHIAAVYDVVESDGSLCVVMELLRGETLGGRLRRRPLTIQQLVRYGRQTASALKHAHARGIVHCDLTPSNVFITEEDEVKVVDFGLARVIAGGPQDVGDDVGASAALIARRPGTPGYMSPEQSLGLPLDPRTDVYSLGVLLREMTRHLEAPAPSRHASPPLPDPIPTLLPIVDRAAAPDRTARYQSIEDVDTALAAIPIEPPHSDAAGARRYVPLAALLLAIVVLLIGLRDRDISADSTSAIVGVPPFASASADPSLGYLAAGLTEMLATELTASNAVVTARSPVVVASEKEAAALATELGASVLLLGRVERQGSGLVTSLRVYRAGASAFGSPSSFTRRDDDLPGIRRALASTARSELVSAGFRLRESKNRQADATEKLLPQTMGRFEEYAQARWYLDRADVPANADYALSILNRLVKEEPRFAMAHAALGEAVVAQVAGDARQVVVGRGAAARARSPSAVPASARSALRRGVDLPGHRPAEGSARRARRDGAGSAVQRRSAATDGAAVRGPRACR